MQEIMLHPILGNTLSASNTCIQFCCIYLNPRNHTKLLSQKSWHLGIRNGPIARGFWNLNQSIEQKVKNLQLEKCRCIKDIKITFWDTAQYFHSKQLIKSFEKIFSLKFVQVGYKRPNRFFQINIVTCSFMPASQNLQLFLNHNIFYLKNKIVNLGIFFGDEACRKVT